MEFRESLKKYCKIKSEQLALRNSFYSRINEKNQQTDAFYDDKKEQVEKTHFASVSKIENKIKEEETFIEKIKDNQKEKEKNVDMHLDLSRAKKLKKEISTSRSKSKIFNYNFYDSIGNSCIELSKQYNVKFNIDDFNKQRELTYESCDKRFAFSYGVRKIFSKLGFVGDIVLIICFLIALGSMCSLFGIPGSAVVGGIGVAVCSIFIVIGLYDLIIGKIIDKQKSKESVLIKDCVQELDKLDEIISKFNRTLKAEIAKESSQLINIHADNIDSLKENIRNFDASKEVQLNDIDKERDSKIEENNKQVENMFTDEFKEYNEKLSSYTEFDNAFSSISSYKTIDSNDFYDYYHDYELNDMSDFKYATKKIIEILEEEKRREYEEMRKQEQERLEKDKKDRQEAQLINALRRKCQECADYYNCPLSGHLTSPCASFRPYRPKSPIF